MAIRGSYKAALRIGVTTALEVFDFKRLGWMVYEVQEEEEIMQKFETGYTYMYTVWVLKKQDSTLNLLKWKMLHHEHSSA